jgi:hypothetical protein
MDENSGEMKAVEVEDELLRWKTKWDGPDMLS